MEAGLDSRNAAQIAAELKRLYISEAGLNSRGAADREASMAERRLMEAGLDSRNAANIAAEAARQKLGHFYDLSKISHEAAYTKDENRLDREAEAAQREFGQNLASQELNNENFQKMEIEMRKEGLAGTEEQVKIIDRLLEPYLSGDRVVRDIPGIGYGMPLGMNEMIAKVFAGEEGQKIFNAMSALRNKILKADSGTQVTGSEFKRFENALAAGIGSNDQEIMNAYNLFKEYLSKQAERIRTAYGNPSPPGQNQSGQNSTNNALLKSIEAMIRSGDLEFE